MPRASRTPPIPADVRAVIDRLESHGPIRTKAMFGGHGIWCADRFVAIVFRDVLYLKVNARTRPLFEAAGCTPFQMSVDRPSRLAFYTPPDDVPTGSDALDVWLDRALAAAGARSATSGR